MSESVIIQTKVKNTSFRLSKIDGMWYVIPTGFAALHLTPDEAESIVDSFREATARAIAMNAMRETESLFAKESKNAE